MLEFITPEILYTLLTACVFMAIGVLSYNRHTREHNQLTPRLVPWGFIAMGCLATSFMVLVHLANLLGLETGAGRR